jgi:hypothetical protein
MASPATAATQTANGPTGPPFGLAAEVLPESMTLNHEDFGRPGCLVQVAT